MKPVQASILICLFALFSISSDLFSQSGASQKTDTLKREVIVDGKRFRCFNNYVTGGGGGGYNSRIPPLQFAGGLDYNFHLNIHYFQAGLFLSGDAFRNYNNTQFHLCYGRRKENELYHFAYFGGMSFSNFYRRTGFTYSKSPESSVGAYACAQLIKKITYDVGIGFSLFGDINFTQAFAGARIDLYFSGAYRGKTGE